MTVDKGDFSEGEGEGKRHAKETCHLERELQTTVALPTVMLLTSLPKPHFRRAQESTPCCHSESENHKVLCELQGSSQERLVGVSSSVTEQTDLHRALWSMGGE